MTPLDHIDAPLTARAPAQGGARGPRALLPGLPRQDGVSHPAVPGYAGAHSSLQA